MKKRITALALAFVMVLGTVALAAGTEKNITVSPMTLNINGQVVTPTKSDGSAAEVFAYDGATYVPLRYLSELLGIDVDWDKESAGVAQLTSDKITLPTAKFKAGTYTASVQGMQGSVTVETSFSDNAIEAVKVTKQNETPTIALAALEQIPTRIVEQQSLMVDMISGATVTSTAILEAVKLCVEQAGGNVDALMVAPDQAKISQLTTQEIATDIVVIGAGGAGLTAAIAAAEQGASVIVVEKMASVGGTTAISSGLVQVAGTQQQAAAGIVGDNWEIYATDIYERGGQLGNKAIIDVICQNAYNTMEWLETNGITWNPEIQQKHGEDVTYLRTIAPLMPEGYKGACGGVITDILSQRLTNMGATIMLNTKAEQILMQDGAAAGIVAVNSVENTEYTIRAKSVIIATGGFAANSALAHQYDPTFPAENTDFRAFPGCLGEGIIMGKEIGAAVIDMDYMKIVLSSGGPSVAVRDALFVNEGGERFTAEDAETQVLTRAINMQEGSHCYMIYDGTTLGEVTDDIQKMIDTSVLYAADSLADLAAQLNINADTLSASITAYNEIVNGKALDPYGRTAFGNTVETGPFYAVERHSRLHYTIGGLKIDTDAHVMDTQNRIISGLYAAGETTGGIHGNYRVGAYSLSEVLVMGRIAGTNAAAGK